MIGSVIISVNDDPEVIWVIISEDRELFCGPRYISSTPIYSINSKYKIKE